MDSAIVARHKVVMRAGLRMLDNNPLTAEQRIEVYAAIAYLRERAEGQTVKPSASPGLVSRLRKRLRRDVALAG
jgi:hypothetical protein